MEYQTFRGTDVKAALEAVKAALGPDAMIGATRHVRNGRSGALSGAYVEVEAAHPKHRVGPFSARTDLYKKPRPQRQQRRLGAPSLSAAEQHDHPSYDPASEELLTTPRGATLSTLEDELETLKAMLQELQATRPPKERAQAMLAGLGIEGALAHELANGAGRARKRSHLELQSWLRGRIESRFKVLPGLLDAPGKQLIACVGPTGVGKTTTLAKLAARARLDHGRSVGVISLDTFRVGAAEQWERYGELMGLQVCIARNRDMLCSALQQNSEVILVDTPGHLGRQAEDARITDALQALPARKTSTLLVLPAWLRGDDVEEVTRSYDGARPTALVATKLDEASRVGGMLHGAAARDLPFAYFCDGPKVPEDITDATSDALLSAVFDRQKP